MSSTHNYEAYVTDALTNPGKLSTCYSVFHNYSLGNQLLAMMQLPQAEPINTYKGWQSLGRQVKKGSKAIALIMPVTGKKTDAAGNDTVNVFFCSRNNWFGLSQTEGADYVAPVVPNFDSSLAITGLGLSVIAYEITDGNCQGYAKPAQGQIAINPVAANPLKTTIHEMAHCLLHADQTSMNDGANLDKDVKEVEAELTAYIVMAVLGHTERLHESRGYIQSWIQSNTNEKVRYSKVFGAVDKILKAGRPETQTAEAA